MKKVQCIFLAAFILLLSSCEKEYENFGYIPPSTEVGYTDDEAAEIMTLAAIAYIADEFTTQIIKDSIEIMLKDSSLATAGRWELVWGPGINSTNSNLIYIARKTNTEKNTYAMAVRGTSIYSITDILQDIEVFTLVPFKYGMAGDSIASGSMAGLDILLQTKDPLTGELLADFLAGIVDNLKGKMYITGHSQGGALAPLLTYWFITSSGIVDKFDIETYAFAGPSVGNKTFSKNFMNALPRSAYFHMVANSLDVVPFFWARYDSLVKHNIPAHVPLLYRDMFIVIKEQLEDKKIKYYQLGQMNYIGSFPPKDTLGNIHPSDTIAWYNHWVIAEHQHNNYLRLLGGNPVK